MLSVMIRHKRSKREYLEECDAIEWEVEADAPDRGLLIVRKDGTSSHLPPSDSDEHIRDVFVMNSAGQTVARYVL